MNKGKMKGSKGGTKGERGANVKVREDIKRREGEMKIEKKNRRRDVKVGEKSKNGTDWGEGKREGTGSAGQEN